MNYGELKQQVANWYHRTDLDDQMQQFAQNITEDLQRRLGLELQVLIADEDTNTILDHNGSIYLDGCLREAAAYTHDGAGEQTYDARYQRGIRDLNINYRGSEWDTTPPVMTPYEPEAT